MSPALAVLLALAVLPGCGRLAARMKLRSGNASYKAHAWPEALAAYNVIPNDVPERLQAQLGIAYTYMAQYRWGSKLPIDRERAQQCIDAFDAYLKILPPGTDDPHLPNRDQVDEWVITMLVDAERFDDAIARLNKQLEKKPNDPAIMRGIAQAYEKWGKQARAIQEYQKLSKLFPKDAGPDVLIAAQCWSISFRQASNLEPLQRNRWVDTGMNAAEAALRIDPDHFEGLTYKNLLLRERAKMRIDPDMVAQLMTEANKILARVKEMSEKKKKEAEAAKAKASGSPAPTPGRGGS